MEMGMIELRRISIRMNWMGTYFHSTFWRSRKPLVRSTIITKRRIERLFIYMSRMPNLVRALEPPIDILVYGPTYTTSPRTVPLVRTVVVHIVFYRVSF